MFSARFLAGGAGKLQITNYQRLDGWEFFECVWSEEFNLFFTQNGAVKYLVNIC